jgi:beta-D-xylosidase 4
VPGEDPYESGEYARYFVKGFQEAPEDPEHIQASACCKHYVANSMESTKESDGESFTRHTIDATIPMQDLVDSYMAPFQTCVEQGEVTSLRCSYNAVNGYPSCQSVPAAPQMQHLTVPSVLQARITGSCRRWPGMLGVSMAISHPT